MCRYWLCGGLIKGQENDKFRLFTEIFLSVHKWLIQTKPEHMDTVYQSDLLFVDWVGSVGAAAKATWTGYGYWKDQSGTQSGWKRRMRNQTPKSEPWLDGRDPTTTDHKILKHQIQVDLLILLAAESSKLIVFYTRQFGSSGWAFWPLCGSHTPSHVSISAASQIFN